jgi:hypothetical protein
MRNCWSEPSFLSLGDLWASVELCLTAPKKYSNWAKTSASTCDDRLRRIQTTNNQNADRNGLAARFLSEDTLGEEVVDGRFGTHRYQHR